MTKLYKQEVDTSHRWVTVVNPLNHHTLLQACDGCGVVKSENSIIRACKADKHIHLISDSLQANSLVG